MTNNDILRRIRYTFDYNDTKMIDLFKQADLEVSRAEISDWLKKEDDVDYKDLTDSQLASFLNGFINDRRGKKDGPQPEPEKRLSNNIIFRKLKIALDLQADDILAILELAELRISNHELSAFFRKKGHKHYRQCQDQVLRNFLSGMQEKYRPNTEKKAIPDNVYNQQKKSD